MTLSIAIMARYPHGADVKTRLAARLDQAARARLYEAFLRDKMLAAESVPDTRVTIVYTPAAMRPWFQAFAASHVSLHAQSDGPLGARVIAAFDELLSVHPLGVILTDSDTPNLPREYLSEAVSALRAGDELVLGPAHDGGYYLVGLARPEPSIFAEVEWSTSRALEQTIAAAACLGLKTHLLPPWYDVDCPEDLERLVVDIREGSGERCPHTQGALQALGFGSQP